MPYIEIRVFALFLQIYMRDKGRSRQSASFPGRSGSYSGLSSAYICLWDTFFASTCRTSLLLHHTYSDKRVFVTHVPVLHHSDFCALASRREIRDGERRDLEHKGLPRTGQHFPKPTLKRRILHCNGCALCQKARRK